MSATWFNTDPSTVLLQFVRIAFETASDSSWVKVCVNSFWTKVEENPVTQEAAYARPLYEEPQVESHDPPRLYPPTNPAVPGGMNTT
jgi:hypothetical protein